MAYAKGVEGVIKIGSDTLGQCSGWSIDVTQDTVEVSNIGSTVKTFESTMVGWSASVEIFWDAGSDAAQPRLIPGGGIPTGAQAAVTIEFYYEGTTAADKYFTGDAFVTGISPAEEANGVMTASVTLQGTGALTESVVT